MSFLQNLAKGFIRSAVNQVGRDSGRVISNKIYVNAHATKVQEVRSQSANVPIALPEVAEFDLVAIEGSVVHFSDENPPTEAWVRSNFEPVVYESSFFMNGLMLLGSIFSPIIGPAFWLLKSGSSFLKKNITYRGFRVVPNLISDGSFKEGYRQEGNRQEPFTFQLPIGNLNERFMLKGLACLTLAVSLVFVQWRAYLVISEVIEREAKLEKAVAEWVQMKDGVWADMNFKEKQITPLDTITFADSAALIRSKYTNGKLSVEEQKEHLEKSYKELLSSKLRGKRGKFTKEKDEVKRNMEIYQRQVELLERYEKIPKNVIGLRFSCTYEITNSITGNTRQVITDTFLISSDLSKVISN